MNLISFTEALSFYDLNCSGYTLFFRFVDFKVAADSTYCDF